MDIKIVFHPSGDWEALYIDGELADKGHNISLSDFIKAYNKVTYLKEEYPFFKYDTRDLGNEEGFDEDFSFPLKYEDIDANKLSD